jgi:muramoyltetrapeptide carboxypeptidase
MSKPIEIGIVAPSAMVPSVELKIGIERIRQEGFLVDEHPQCREGHLFFAGTDQQRSEAFFEFAKNQKHQVIWCARGGHGAIRLLPLLKQLAAQHGNPEKKLLVGYSDATALMEFVRDHWGWSTLHAPMPSLRKFSILDKSDWEAISEWVRGRSILPPWSQKKLSYWVNPPTSPIQGKLVGGNLTVWASLIGTPYQGQVDGRILFLEDVDESLYRIDRMLQQLKLSGAFRGVQAIVLGNFLNCKDYSPQVLRSLPSKRTRQRMLTVPKPKELKPLRKVLPELKTLRQMFAEVGEGLGIPVAYGLPVGHGPEVSPMPLGADYQLHPEGFLELVNWDWTELSN